MTRLTLVLALTTTGLVGCGDDDGSPALDAGVIDSGAGDVDAGPTDAGPTEPDDAGEPDAGTPPTPLEMAVDDARNAVGEASLAVAALSEAMRADAEFLELEMTLVRLDAVIGEKISSLIDRVGVIGEKTLRPASLPPSAVPALIVARQVTRAWHDLDAQLVRTSWETSSDPDLAALGARLAAARAALERLSELMWERFRAIVDSVDSTSFPEDEYVDARDVVITPVGSTVHAVVEGRDETDPTAVVSVNCGDTFGIRVFDEERGTSLLETEGPYFGEMWTLPLPAETPSSIQIELSGAFSNWRTCELSVTGHRHWRGAQIVIDSAEATTLGDLRSMWADRMATAETQLAALVAASSANQPVVDEVIEYLAELDAATSVWRGDRTTWYEDDYEIFDLTFSQVLDPMGVALASSAHLAPMQFEDLRNTLAALRAIDEQARQTLSPTGR